MERLTKRLNDGFIAGSATLISSSAAAQEAVINTNSIPAQNPVLTQVVVPILMGIVVPFLKEWLLEVRERRKERRKHKHKLKDAE